MSLAERLYDLLMRHRVVVAVLLLGSTGLVGAGAARVRFDNSYRIWFMDDDPALVSYDRFTALFGSDETLVLALDAAGDAFSSETLALVKRLSDALQGERGVEQVWSLTHMEAMVDAGGSLELRPLIDQIPPPAATLARARVLVRDSPLYRGLVSDDGKATALLLTLQRTEGSFDAKAELVRRLRARARELAGSREVWFAGGVILDDAIYRYSERDVGVYSPVMFVLIVVALGWIFRSPAAVAAPLLVVIMSIFWSVGLMGWLGWDANLVTTILPVLLAAIGIADSVHLLQQVRMQRRQGAEPEAALRRAFVHVLRPCLITALTTAAGMASLMAASLPAIRELGVQAAVGIMAAFVLTMAGVPILLAVLPRRLLGGLDSTQGAPAPRWLTATAHLAIRRRWVVVSAAALVLVAAMLGLPRLRTGTTMSTYFFDDDPVYQESVQVDRAFGGSMPMQVLVQAKPGQRDLLDPENLGRVDAIADYLRSLPATGRTFSGVDFIKEARRVVLGAPPGKLTLPGSRQEAAQLLLLLEGEEDLRRYLSDDRRRARIEVSVAASDYEQLIAVYEQIERRIGELAGGAATAQITGLTKLLGAMEQYLSTSQRRSFGLAFLLVMGFIALLFRSIRIGLLSAVPNLWPLVVILGLMGWSGIALDVSTVMIAPLLLGIVVDDTVHVLERVLRGRREGQQVEEAFEGAVGRVGPAVLMTTVILTLGFLTPLLGSFKPNYYFALLAALALVLALLADLIIFPAVGALVPWLVPGGRRRPD